MALFIAEALDLATGVSADDVVVHVGGRFCNFDVDSCAWSTDDGAGMGGVTMAPGPNMDSVVGDMPGTWGTFAGADEDVRRGTLNAVSGGKALQLWLSGRE